MEKIDRIEVWGREIPLGVHFPTSYKDGAGGGERYLSHHVFVRVYAGDLVGWGEGTELPMFTGGTSSTMAEIIRTQFAPLMIGATIDRAFQIFYQTVMGHPHNPGAKLGLESALYDLLAKTRSCPLSDLLGRRRRDQVRICYHIGAVSLEEAVAQARGAIDAGFRTLKLKADGNIPKDVERILAVTDVLSSDALVRVDANQGWESFRKAGEALHELAWERQIEYIEQPVHRDRTEDMRKLSDRFGIPIFADESVVGPEEALHLVDSNLVDGLCIKVAKCGSLAHGVLIADIAAMRRIPVTPVSAFATSLGVSAELQMLSVMPLLSSAAELCHYMLSEDPGRPRLPFAPLLSIPEVAGNGAEVEESAFPPNSRC
jgi:L-alanine-DL-glutamate epimerase-like enolase superfamily enzyme